MVWNHGYERGHRAPDFLKLMTQTAGQWHAPFTLFGGIKSDHGRADLKIGGLIPIVSGARALSIRHDVRQRATPERLKGVAARGIGSPKDVDAVIEAHRVILGAILNQQLIDTEQGIPLSTKVDVERFDKHRLAELKDALHKVDLIVAMVGEGRI
jgi:DNA polymerase-3 subunit epsilon/CBS domain-containing protein